MNPVSESDAIVEEITIKGSAERIFQALTNPEARIKWSWRAAGSCMVSAWATSGWP